jgi:hypothetical protein
MRALGWVLTIIGGFILALTLAGLVIFATQANELQQHRLFRDGEFAYNLKELREVTVKKALLYSVGSGIFFLLGALALRAAREERNVHPTTDTNEAKALRQTPNFTAPRPHETLVKTRPKLGEFQGERTVFSNSYKLFLIKTFQIQRNDVLQKFVCDDRLFDTVDEALKYAAQLEQKAAANASPRTHTTSLSQPLHPSGTDQEKLPRRKEKDETPEGRDNFNDTRSTEAWKILALPIIGLICVILWRLLY